MVPLMMADIAVMSLARRSRLSGAMIGNAAADAGLVEDVDALLPRQGQQLGAVLGHDLLVGGHDVATHFERPLYVVVGRFLAAQELDDYVEA